MLRCFEIFELLRLRRLFCEPNAFNVAPNNGLGDNVNGPDLPFHYACRTRGPFDFRRQRQLNGEGRALPRLARDGDASAVRRLAERLFGDALRDELPAALASQVPWIVGMMWAYFTVYPDGSFLIAAGLAAAACAAAVLAWVAGRRTIPA